MIDCILIPTVRNEWSALIQLLSDLPRPGLLFGKVTLVLSLDDKWLDEEKGFLTQIIENSSSSNFFKKIVFISCDIPPHESVYLREPSKNSPLLKYGQKSGPNILFFRSIQKIIELKLCGYSVLLMETDIIPLSKNWLDKLNEELNLAQNFLIAGSRYRGKGKLSKDIVNHINGNAIYNISNIDFLRFFKLWEYLLIKFITYDNNIAYDIAIEYILANKDYFSTEKLIQVKITELESLYNTRRIYLKSLVNYSGAYENSDDYSFSANNFYNEFPDCVLLHCKASLPFKTQLRTKYIPEYYNISDNLIPLKEYVEIDVRQLKIVENIIESKGKSRQKNKFFILTCNTRLKLNEKNFKLQYAQKPEIFNAVHIALSNIELHLKHLFLKKFS